MFFSLKHENPHECCVPWLPEKHKSLLTVASKLMTSQWGHHPNSTWQTNESYWGQLMGPEMNQKQVHHQKLTPAMGAGSQKLETCDASHSLRQLTGGRVSWYSWSEPLLGSLADLRVSQQSLQVTYIWGGERSLGGQFHQGPLGYLLPELKELPCIVRCFTSV